MLSHLAHTLFDNAFYRSAPPGVKNAHRPILGVDDNYWQAIRREHGKQKSRCVGDQAIASERMFGSLRDTVNKIGMNLAQIHQAPPRLAALCYRGDESASVLRNRRLLVMSRETEIQAAALAIRPRGSALPRAESVDQPRNSR